MTNRVMTFVIVALTAVFAAWMAADWASDEIGRSLESLS